MRSYQKNPKKYFRGKSREFLAPVEKEVKVIDKKSRNIIDKKKADMLKFIDRVRLMSDTLSNFVDNQAGQIKNKSEDCIDKYLKCMKKLKPNRGIRNAILYI